MEAMHTNPVIISFCSILYYARLREYMRLKHNRIISKEIVKRSELLFGKERKIYKKNVVNRWLLYWRLSVNKELIQYRKQNVKANLNRKIVKNILDRAENKVIQSLKIIKMKIFT
jgi:putative lipase involved disintegration of autophagic bodies